MNKTIRKTFSESEVRTVLNLWDGRGSFKNDASGKITQIDLTCSIELPHLKSESMYLLIKHLIKSFEFLKIKHTNQAIHLSITLRPNTLQDFYVLKHRIDKVQKVSKDQREKVMK